jgi:acetyl-CoA carboxylase, biotin carboxylase subunit
VCDRRHIPAGGHRLQSLVIVAQNMFRKVLIANRGEIAVRVIRACREMSIASVAVFSEVDRAALHVIQADEAYPIGPAPARESYLNAGRILDVAHRSGAEAIHPGYGFLSENAQFARACAEAGFKFIGPPPAAMELMGSKTRARQAMQAAGVPFVPGSARGLSLAEAEALAVKIGYPVMIKAAAGGGGKGMRLVQAASELQAAFETAASEALRSFNDAEVYLEKYIVDPRHIEIQVLGDEHGNVVYLGERECSVQRRHQKVIEEAPSAVVDEDLRRRMGAVAVQAAKSAGYANAGTVEFLVDVARNFYFLEMNTRSPNWSRGWIWSSCSCASPPVNRCLSDRKRSACVATRWNAASTPRIRTTTSFPRPARSRACCGRQALEFARTAASTRVGRYRSITILCWRS